VLHLETAPAESQPPAAPSPEQIDPEMLARRYGVIDRQRREIDEQWRQLHDALCRLLHARPDRTLQCDDGRYTLTDQAGIETLQWTPQQQTTNGSSD